MIRTKIIAPIMTTIKARIEYHLLSDPAEALKYPATLLEK
jgi:hypothetical protein